MEYGMDHLCSNQKNVVKQTVMDWSPNAGSATNEVEHCPHSSSSKRLSVAQLLYYLAGEE
jgi:hypothetical protein